MGPGGHAYGGVVNTFRSLLQKEGPGSLYVGLLPAVISMAPAGAVFYGVYDLLKVLDLFFTMHHRYSTFQGRMKQDQLAAVAVRVLTSWHVHGFGCGCCPQGLQGGEGVLSVAQQAARRGSRGNPR